ncbi:MAG: histidine kinase [Nocardioides sp.]|uniref:sensor histidine kinase n=1 Tax=Nocardioides sp. TaxID=35761 RepID=UPI0039E5E1B8
MIHRLRTTRLDAALAVAFLVVGLIQVEVFPIAAVGRGELFAVLSTLPLAWRRTFPIQSSLVASASWLIPLDGFPVLGLVVVILQFLALGMHGRPLRAVVAVTAWASALSVVGTLLGPEAPVAAIGGVLAVVAPVLAGLAVRHERRQKQALAELADQLRAERARAEQDAIDLERSRIAQELHDVVGHDVTLIAIQAEAAAAALRVSGPQATTSVEAIRATAHHTMTQIRAVLDVLAPWAGQGHPGPESPSELADRARAAGIDNTLAVTGTPPTDQEPVTLAVNRILRECLTNAGKHAPGQPVTLTVDWSPDAVELRSTNPTDALTLTPTPGRGLTGIRHRAELLGGTSNTTVANGQFEVQVKIPARRPAPAGGSTHQERT